MSHRRLVSRVVVLMVVLVLMGATLAVSKPLRLATTTSTENSGLLTEILPKFTESTGIEVHVIAVGTGKALKLGEAGDVDVVLVHAPSLEEAFVEAGHGIDRRAVMYNDFVMVGPESDPARIGGRKDAAAALETLSTKKAVFVSRGDQSGTHQKELDLWSAARVKPTGSWYREAGQGMGRVLQMADELDAYTLADRGTWLAMRTKVPHLAVLVEGDVRMHNPYGVIAVNPAKHPDIAKDEARRFIEWLTSAETQKAIGSFKVDGEVLFHPMALDPKN